MTFESSVLSRLNADLKTQYSLTVSRDKYFRFKKQKKIRFTLNLKATAEYIPTWAWLFLSFHNFQPNFSSYFARFCSKIFMYLYLISTLFI